VISNNSQIHNQTDAKQINADIAARENNQPLLGVGLFLLPEPEKGILEFRKAIVEGITYKECILRGQYCLAFKWVSGALDRNALFCRQDCANGTCPDTFCICNSFQGHICT
jgi:hypothetical protein